MRSHRLKLVLAYDGRDFAGWQSQKHRHTVQDEIEKALRRICGQRIAVIGAGRTDAGVHALGQCAHVDVPADKLAPERWLRALNALLPVAVRVLRARWVPPGFHARYSATSKTYRYRIVRSSIFSPFELGRAWHVKVNLDLVVLKESARLFVGRHDFAGFAANRGKPEPGTRRTMESVRLSCRGELIQIEFTGDGFLYKMVRLMVGAMVSCASGRHPPGQIAAQLRNPSDTGSRLAAPPDGLYLVRVRY